MKRKEIQRDKMEQEYLSHSSITSPQAKMERRKARKMLVERKRRERMDRCFDKLKCLLNSRGRESIEKADILESSVELLERLVAKSMSDPLTDQFHEGYFKCATDVEKYMLHNYEKETAMRHNIKRFMLENHKTITQTKHQAYRQNVKTPNMISPFQHYPLGPHQSNYQIPFYPSFHQPILTSTPKSKNAVVKMPSETNRQCFFQYSTPKRVTPSNSIDIKSSVKNKRNPESSEDSAFYSASSLNVKSLDKYENNRSKIYNNEDSSKKILKKFKSNDEKNEENKENTFEMIFNEHTKSPKKITRDKKEIIGSNVWRPF